MLFKKGFVLKKKVLVHASQKFPDIADRGFVFGPGSETYLNKLQLPLLRFFNNLEIF